MRRTILLISALTAPSAFAFQTYSFQTEKEFRLPSDYLNLSFHLSPSYFDFQSQHQKPINPLIIAMWSEAFERITSQSGVKNLSYSYGGTFDPQLVRRAEFKPDASISERKIYIDLTGSDWQGLPSEHAGQAIFLFSPKNPEFIGGGIEAFNTKMFDIVHPDLNIVDTIMHEQLHLLGLDHSSIYSARMSYGNPEWENLSDDDIRGLQHLYGGGASTSISIRTTLDESAAQGVEVVLINTSTGQSYSVISNWRYGIANMRGIPVGTYYIAGREITPSGPCFSNPTKGFLTSFYVDDQTATNRIEEAAQMTITENQPVEMVLNLIAGTKRFDCYWGVGRYTSQRVSDAKQSWELQGRDDVIQSGVAPGTLFGWQVYTELDVLESKRTNTDPESGLHPSLVLNTIGAQHPLQIDSQAWDVYLEEGYAGPYLEDDKKLIYEGRYSSSAKAGNYAAYCEADGEIALISSLAEVVPGLKSQRTNAEIFPQFAGLMSEASAPKSVHVGGLPQPRDPKEASDLGIVICGVIGAKAPLSSVAAGLILFLLPILVGACQHIRSPRRDS
jgi:hypothetical protein